MGRFDDCDNPFLVGLFISLILCIVITVALISSNSEEKNYSLVTRSNDSLKFKSFLDAVDHTGYPSPYWHRMHPCNLSIFFTFGAQFFGIVMEGFDVGNNNLAVPDTLDSPFAVVKFSWWSPPISLTFSSDLPIKINLSCPIYPPI